MTALWFPWIALAGCVIAVAAHAIMLHVDRPLRVSGWQLNGRARPPPPLSPRQYTLNSPLCAASGLVSLPEGGAASSGATHVHGAGLGLVLAEQRALKSSLVHHQQTVLLLAVSVLIVKVAIHHLGVHALATGALHHMLFRTNTRTHRPCHCCSPWALCCLPLCERLRCLAWTLQTWSW